MGSTRGTRPHALPVRYPCAGQQGWSRAHITASSQWNLRGGITEADKTSRNDYEKSCSTIFDGLKKTAES